MRSTEMIVWMRESYEKITGRVRKEREIQRNKRENFEKETAFRTCWTPEERCSWAKTPGNEMELNQIRRPANWSNFDNDESLQG